MIAAVVFDLDGVLLDSEQVWDEVRREVVGELGGTWRVDATAAMQGMSSPEWSAYLHDVLGVPGAPDEIADVVVERLLARYARGLPLLPGALEAVGRLGATWPLGLASSSNRVVIERVLLHAGLAGAFAATVSSEEVAAGKPSPDVYLETARRLGVPAPLCAAVEDSANGLRAAFAAGMQVVAVPNRHFPPPADLLARAALVVEHLDDLTAGSIGTSAGGADPRAGGEPARELASHLDEALDEAERESFPASDPHADWAGRDP